MEGLNGRQRKIVRKIESLANWEGFYVLCSLMLDVNTSKPVGRDGFPTNMFFHTSTYEAIAKTHERGDKEDYRRKYDAKLAEVRSEMRDYFKMARDDGLLKFSNLKLHYGLYTGRKYRRI